MRVSCLVQGQSEGEGAHKPRSLPAGLPRGRGHLDAPIATAFQSVTPKDAASWSASCGYTI